MKAPKATRITKEMIREVLTTPKGFRLWLVRDSMEWSVVVAGAVDGTEDHVFTTLSVWRGVVWTTEGGMDVSDYQATADALNAHIYTN